MADREYVITFEGEKARIWLAPPSEKMLKKQPGNYATVYFTPPEYHVVAPSAARAEQIARAMRKPK